MRNNEVDLTEREQRLTITSFYINDSSNSLYFGKQTLFSLTLSINETWWEIEVKLDPSLPLCSQNFRSVEAAFQFS